MSNQLFIQRRSRFNFYSSDDDDDNYSIGNESSNSHLRGHSSIVTILTCMQYLVLANDNLLS